MVGRLLISALPGEVRSAWLEDGRLLDLVISHDTRPNLLGNLYLGRVTKLDRALDCAFVEVGLERPGFLPFTEGPGRKLNEGDSVAVRVLREPAEAKGPRLTARLKNPPPDLDQLTHGRKPPLLLASGDDPVQRLLEQGPLPEEILVDDRALFAACQARLGDNATGRLRLDNDPVPLFEREGIEPEIDALLHPRVDLPSGGFLLIEPVTTLTAIDVNSGRRRVRERSDEMALALDLAAAQEIPRQLRLRSLSGLIVVDFLALAERTARAKVIAGLRAGLKRDPEPGRVQPMAPSGLVELTRRRGRPALYEILCAPCGLADSGRVKSPATLAYQALRLALREGAGRAVTTLSILATPDVAEALDGPLAAARAAIETRLGGPLTVIAESGPPGQAAEIRIERPK